jgi:hypothetical protein
LKARTRVLPGTGRRASAFMPSPQGAIDTTMLCGIAPDLPPEHTLAPDEVAAAIARLWDDDPAPACGQTMFVCRSWSNPRPSRPLGAH